MSALLQFEHQTVGSSVCSSARIAILHVSRCQGQCAIRVWNWKLMVCVADESGRLLVNGLRLNDTQEFVESKLSILEFFN